MIDMKYTFTCDHCNSKIDISENETTNIGMEVPRGWFIFTRASIRKKNARGIIETRSSGDVHFCTLGCMSEFFPKAFKGPWYLSEENEEKK